MATAISITDMYMSILASLSNDAKLDLISKLTDSMRRKKVKTATTTEDVFACFHTDWGGDHSPEDIEKEIRQSRTFTREFESW